ncbi:MAG TPA: hypothetical protein IAB68_03485 [Candidatus Aphodocola excrementigallinarum]|uniref:Uncharacterized protein n=1 Tax=Candidatus Aphodocola excrementigallinarum TaxID=2840670 RepID=A0A9D1IMF8_9FIRM|nr:hypothetical protein [Candidatus Aphodocola excrementigallinarum]
MNQVNDKLYSNDYYKALKKAYKWPNWKKEFVNNCLFISKHSKKLPLYIDGDYGIESIDITRLVDASFEYADLDNNCYDASEEVVDSILIKTNI